MKTFGKPVIKFSGHIIIIIDLRNKVVKSWGFQTKTGKPAGSSGILCKPSLNYVYCRAFM